MEQNQNLKAKKRSRAKLLITAFFAFYVSVKMVQLSGSAELSSCKAVNSSSSTFQFLRILMATAARKPARINARKTLAAWRSLEGLLSRLRLRKARAWVSSFTPEYACV